MLDPNCKELRPARTWNVDSLHVCRVVTQSTIYLKDLKFVDLRFGESTSKVASSS